MAGAFLEARVCPVVHAFCLIPFPLGKTPHFLTTNFRNLAAGPAGTGGWEREPCDSDDPKDLIIHGLQARKSC